MRPVAGRSGPGLFVLGALLTAALAWPLADSRADDPRDRPYPHGEYQEDCNLCHRDEQWLPAEPTKEFVHSKRFPLQGAHRTVRCGACHVSLEFKRARKDCVSCHQDVHRGEMGTDCGRCHSPRSFIDRSEALRLHRTLRFPLSGAHAAADCEACHRSRSLGRMMYVNLPVDCAGCHDSTAYPAAPQKPVSEPVNHDAAGFPSDCARCHNTVSFAGAAFDHSVTAFPLTGAHVGLPCSSCHADGVYAGRSTACYSCHQAAYESVTDPNHRVAGFSTECELCHVTTGFAGARFTQHDGLYFPIYAGRHAERWAHCSDCHTNSGSYAVFYCLSCHPQQETDSRHTTVVSYEYVSNACYVCHPTGSANSRGIRR